MLEVPKEKSLEAQLEHVQKTTKVLLTAGYSRSKLGKKGPTVAAIHSSAAPVVASTGPSQTSNVTLFPNSVQPTCRAKVPAVRGDIAWIGCLKGKSKSRLLDASSDFWTEIGKHVQVSSCKKKLPAIILYYIDFTLYLSRLVNDMLQCHPDSFKIGKCPRWRFDTFTGSHSARQINQLVCQECGYKCTADRLVKLVTLMSVRYTCDFAELCLYQCTVHVGHFVLGLYAKLLDILHLLQYMITH